MAENILDEKMDAVSGGKKEDLQERDNVRCPKCGTMIRIKKGFFAGRGTHKPGVCSKCGYALEKWQ